MLACVAKTFTSAICTSLQVRNRAMATRTPRTQTASNVGGINITIQNCTVHNGDDCVPVTVGPLGYTANVNVHDVHCECGTNGGVIYNAGGTVRDVLFESMTVTHTNQGLGVKIARPGYNATDGLVTNITWRNISIVNPRNAAIYTNVFSEDAATCNPPPNPNLPNWLTVRNVTLHDIRAVVNEGQMAGCFLCTPGRPCNGYVFNGVHIRLQDGKDAAPYSCHNMAASSRSQDYSPVPCGL